MSLDIYLKPEQYKETVNYIPIPEHDLRKIAKASADNAVRVIAELILQNIVGSVYIPRSGEPGFDSSHYKVKTKAIEALKKLTEKE